MPTTSSVSTPRGNDAFGQVARVGLQRLDATGLEHLDVVVVDGGRLGEELLRRHRGEQFGFGDPAGPLLAQNRSVLPQVLDQLWQQTLAGDAVCAAVLVLTKSDGESDIWPPVCRVALRSGAVSYAETSLGIAPQSCLGHILLAVRTAG